MSRVIWQHALTPASSVAAGEHAYPLYERGFTLARTRAFPQTEEEIVELPDPRAYRSMSRAAILLAASGLQSRKALAPFLAADPFSVGLYCAIENGPTDYGSAKQMAHTPDSEFAVTYKKLRSAKQYLRQLPNLAPAQLGIFLDIRGPMNVYNHSRFACIQALEQAEFDLAHGHVKAALVGSAFSLEDALSVQRVRRQVGPTPVISEGAAFLVLTPDGGVTPWRAQIARDADPTFGIATPLVNLTLERTTREH